MDWQVYIIICSDDSLYTGITNDLARRLRAHGGRRGAKYFRGRRPHAVVYLESGHTRSSASRREAELKRLSRVEKLALIAAHGTEAAHAGRL
jgi:putative endonuclease